MRLVCPLCGTVVLDGSEPEPGPGLCPSCGARYAGGGEDVAGSLALALAQLGIEGLDAQRLARRLFELDPGDPDSARVAMTSDRRQGFYRWWLFVRGDDGDAAALLVALASP